MRALGGRYARDQAAFRAWVRSALVPLRDRDHGSLPAALREALEALESRPGIRYPLEHLAKLLASGVAPPPMGKEAPETALEEILPSPRRRSGRPSTCWPRRFPGPS